MNKNLTKTHGGPRGAVAVAGKAGGVAVMAVGWAWPTAPVTAGVGGSAGSDVATAGARRGKVVGTVVSMRAGSWDVNARSLGVGLVMRPVRLGS